MVLDRLGIRRTLALLTVLPSILAAVFGWSVVAAADARADAASDREQLARSITLLGRLRSTATAEIAIYELWSDTVESSGAVDAAPDLLTPTIRSLVDESFEIADDAGFSSDIRVATLRDDVASIRERRDAGDQGLGDALPPIVDRAASLIAPSDQQELLAVGGASAAMVHFTDYIDALTLEVLTGSQLLFGTIPLDSGSARFAELVAAADVRLALVERADQEIGAALGALVEESAFATIRREARNSASGSDGASSSLALLQASASFVDDASTLTSFGTGISERVAADANAERERALDERNRSLALVTTMAILTTIALLVIGRRLGRRLDRLSTTAEQISAGELTLEPIGDRGSDGIAVVANSMDDMVDTLTRVQRQLTALAHGRSSDAVFDEPVPGHLGTTLRVTVDRVREATDRLQAQADTDPLTGVLNRRALERALAERDAPAAVLVIDLDRFKAVNDELGHVAGDDVLVAVAGRLRNIVRDDDLVGRLGGDEFVVATTEIDAVDDIVGRIRDSIRQPINTSVGRATVAASVGAARPVSDEPLDVLIRRADQAMYRAKRRSRATSEQHAGAS